MHKCYKTKKAFTDSTTQKEGTNTEDSWIYRSFGVHHKLCALVFENRSLEFELAIIALSSY